MGKWFRKALKAYTICLFKAKGSFDTLHEFGFDNVTISGDTRLDRVAQIAEAASVLPKLEQFCAGNLVIVAGSTWPEDEAIFLNYINECAHKSQICCGSP